MANDVPVIPVKLLQTPIPETNYFKDNQLLTAEQLNNIVTYFDFQERMTRTFLLGTGIVCGLEINYRQTSIYISRGCAVTTDGDLLVLKDNTDYSLLVPFLDKDALYPPFISGDPPSQTQLWELATTSDDADATPINGFFSDKNPADYIVLLYNESFVKNPDQCAADDCDSRAWKQKNNLRILLIAASDLDHFYEGCTCCDEDFFGLPSIHMRRVSLNEKNTIGFKELATAYTTPILEAYTQLSSALVLCDDVYKNLATCSINAGNELQNASWLSRVSTNFNLISSSAFEIRRTSKAAIILKGASQSQIIKSIIDSLIGKIGIQYLYDFIKDLVEAYTEFRHSLNEICSTCMPAPSLFPKHIALGAAVTSTASAKDYRHHFCASPILHHGDKLIATALRFYYRMDNMIWNFGFSANNEDDIRITPSKGYDCALGERAIPYYYKAPSLVANWHPVSSKQDILSYQASSYSSADSIINPLNYSIDKFSFLRIEGHINKNYVTVLQQIQELSKKNNLPIDIIAVKLGSDYSDTPFKDRCQFNDLDTQFDQWKAGLLCCLSDEIQYWGSFSLKTEKSDDIVRFIRYKDMVEAADDTEVKKGMTKDPSTKGGAKFGASGIGIFGLSGGKPSGLLDLAKDFTVPVKQSGSATLFREAVQEQPKYERGVITEVNTPKDETDSVAALYLANKEQVNKGEVIISTGNQNVFTKTALQILDAMEALTEAIADATLATIDEKAIAIRFNNIEKYLRDAGVTAKKAMSSKSSDVSSYVEVVNHATNVCSDCTKEELSVLLQAYRDRVDDIRRMNLFSNYISQNPGVDHLCGVPKGGTFIIVYKSSRDQIQVPVKSITAVTGLVQGLSNLASVFSTSRVQVKTSSAANESFTNMLSVINDAQVDDNVKLQLKGSLIDKLLLRPQPTDEPIADGIVVADFFVPYQCCSDCAPVTYVFPELRDPEEITPAILLSKTEFCEVDDALFPIVVSPEKGGIVTGAGVSNTNDQWFFSPRSAGKGDQTLTYQFGDKSAMVALKVFAMPEAKFGFTVAETNGNTVIVQFANNTENGASYVWEIEGQQSISDKDPLVTFTLADDSQTFNVKLTAVNGPCKNDTSQSITLQAKTQEEQKPFIAISPTRFVSNDDKQYPISISPLPGGTVSGAGVEQINNQWIFTPVKAGAGNFVLTHDIDGIQAMTPVIVDKKPVINFTSEIEEVSTGTFEVHYKLFTGDPFDSLTWNLGDKNTIPGDKEVVGKYVLAPTEQERKIIVTLTATKGIASTTITNTVLLAKKGTDEHPIIIDTGKTDNTSGGRTTVVSSTFTIKISSSLKTRTVTLSASQAGATLYLWSVSADGKVISPEKAKEVSFTVLSTFKELVLALKVTSGITTSTSKKISITQEKLKKFGFKDPVLNTSLE